MCNADIPPMPTGLLEKLRQPVEPLKVLDSATEFIQPGSIWQVELPDRGLVLMLVTERYEDGEAAPIAFARAIPLSEYMRLGGYGDVRVSCEPIADTYLGHTWLEGPVLWSRFKARLTQAREDSMAEVTKLLPGFDAGLIRWHPRPSDDAFYYCDRLPDVVAYRTGVYDEFTPLFRDAWDELYDQLDDPVT